MCPFLITQTAQICEVSELLPYLQANKFSCYNFKDVRKPRSWVRNKLHYLQQEQKPKCQHLHYLPEPHFPQDNICTCGTVWKRGRTLSLGSPNLLEWEVLYVFPSLLKKTVALSSKAVCFTNNCEKVQAKCSQCLWLQAIQKCERPMENCHSVLIAPWLSFPGLMEFLPMHPS